MSADDYKTMSMLMGQIRGLAQRVDSLERFKKAMEMNQAQGLMAEAVAPKGVFTNIPDTAEGRAIIAISEFIKELTRGAAEGDFGVEFPTNDPVGMIQCRIQWLYEEAKSQREQHDAARAEITKLKGG